MQLERSLEALEVKRETRFQEIRCELSSIIDQRTTIKAKVKNETDMTSKVIKTMDVMRARSIDKVSIMESRDDNAKRSIT